MTPIETANLVKQLARQIGFDLVGITPAAPLHNGEHYRAWIAAGYGGEMRYLRRNLELRLAPQKLLAGARSIVCVGLNYHRPTENSGGATENASDTPPTGQVASYARGHDYHVVLYRMLLDLADRLRDAVETPFDARPFVDRGPILERQLAARAGLGWIGKNTLVLNPALGSFFFLGELVTTLELAPDAPLDDHCGTCTRCLDACPTRAFTRPYEMDASRCISYLTIENRSAIPDDLAPNVGDWVYGCDICQQVCPFNSDAPAATHPDIVVNRAPARIELLKLAHLRAGDHRRLTKGTAARRATQPMWRRNARVALRNALRRETAGATKTADATAATSADEIPAWVVEARRLLAEPVSGQTSAERP